MSGDGLPRDSPEEGAGEEMTSLRSVSACLVFLAAMGGPGLLACDGKKAPSGGAPAAQKPPAPPPTPSALPSTLAKGPEYTDSDFVENDRARDPFRPFLAQPVQGGPRVVANQRDVKLANFSVEELKLAGIVLGGGGPRAMFIDPAGKGHVIMTGNFICRPDTVRAGPSGPEYQVNWRVDRIRDGEVILLREDPAQPSVPPATRVIQLHPEVARGGG